MSQCTPTTQPNRSTRENDPEPIPIKDPELMKAVLEAYKNFTAFHATQETLFWTRNNLLVLMQVGLIAALFGVLARKQPDEWHLIPVGAAGVALVGLFLTFAWIRMVQRSRYLFDVSLSIIAEAEQRLGLGNADCLFTFFYHASKTATDDEHHESLPLGIEARLNKKFLAKGRSVRLSTMWIRVGWCFALAWSLTLCLVYWYCDRAGWNW